MPGRGRCASPPSTSPTRDQVRDGRPGSGPGNRRSSTTPVCNAAPRYRFRDRGFRRRIDDQCAQRLPGHPVKRPRHDRAGPRQVIVIASVRSEQPLASLPTAPAKGAVRMLVRACAPTWQPPASRQRHRTRVFRDRTGPRRWWRTRTSRRGFRHERRPARWGRSRTSRAPCCGWLRQPGLGLRQRPDDLCRRRDDPPCCESGLGRGLEPGQPFLEVRPRQKSWT